MPNQKENPQQQPGASESDHVTYYKNPNTPYGEVPLSCPTCGGNDVHLSRTAVYTRPYDGAETGTRCLIPARDPWIDPTSLEPALTVDDDMRDCPSRNRGGVLLHFICENDCPAFKLALAQVKGLTLIHAEVHDG